MCKRILTLDHLTQLHNILALGFQNMYFFVTPPNFSLYDVLSQFHPLQLLN
jgi:hypothetical protein